MYFLSFLSVDKNMNYSDLRGSAISASHPLKVAYFKISPIVTDNLFVRFRKPFRCDKYLMKILFPIRSNQIYRPNKHFKIFSKIATVETTNNHIQVYTLNGFALPILAHTACKGSYSKCD